MIYSQGIITSGDDNRRVAARAFLCPDLRRVGAVRFECDSEVNPLIMNMLQHLARARIACRFHCIGCLSLLYITAVAGLRHFHPYVNLIEPCTPALIIVFDSLQSKCLIYHSAHLGAMHTRDSLEITVRLLALKC